jgi:hypothetical protein
MSLLSTSGGTGPSAHLFGPFGPPGTVPGADPTLPPNDPFAPFGPMDFPSRRRKPSHPILIIIALVIMAFIVFWIISLMAR